MITLHFHICFWHFKFSCSKHSKNTAMLNCIYRIPNVKYRFARCLLFLQDQFDSSSCQLLSVCIDSELLQLFMPSNSSSIREYHLSLQGSAGCFPTETFRFKSFCYSWKSIRDASIAALMAAVISKRFIHPVAWSAWSSIASHVFYGC